MDVQIKSQTDAKSTIGGQWKIFYRKFKKRKTAVIGLGIILFFLAVAVFAPLIAPYDPIFIDLHAKLLKPSAAHLMGTDDLGRDILSRIIYGTRLSLSVGIVAVLIGLAIGVPLGLISGYYGKMVDAVIMRFVDVLMAFPGMLLALAIVSVLGPSLFNTMIAVGIFSVPTFARIVRVSTLAVRKQEYVDALRALGLSDVRIILGHILPNILSPIVVQGTLRLATALLTAAGLSFLGMGAQPPSPEWGAMLSNGRDYLWSAPYITIFPGMTIALLVLGFNTFGDGLRDAMDQRLS